MQKLFATFGLAVVAVIAIAAYPFVKMTDGKMLLIDEKIQFVPSPTSSNYCDGRFTIWSDKTNVVVDNDSGITWTKNAAPLGHGTNWYASTNWVAEFTCAGYDDWRLASKNEFSRYYLTNGFFGIFTNTPPALPAGHPFTDIFSHYWTSTTIDAEYAAVQYWDGVPDSAESLNNYYRAWPCRGP